ncbi:uncharacterized protein RMCC_5908 [Mycolicibacterium canariasense]|uniref:Uncharacterized protein n=1 Tax=Mycolicibacterium canariasense TaxID=228230 RepID=A0A124E357_MYCCR|nr:hypothetical protein [Mycolicibacterium canariasense]MCV7208371.1 hypothetical protein [Mycolicibacterium canariasense]ORV13555.1 hypothetical protein AWB94_04860 [Mycolicibacterium canariasense]GAS98943.1 uncharacterized protein RMCC_5908 [Mycolicibacterium canariasense]
MRVSATDIRTMLESGYSVTLERNGCTWQLPAIPSRRTREFPAWGLLDEVYAGDRLTIRETTRPLMLAMIAVVPHATPSPWYGWANTVLLQYFSHPECPACTTAAGHPIDIPTGLTETDPWVVRTCITCETSWRQETFQ